MDLQPDGYYSSLSLFAFGLLLLPISTPRRFPSGVCPLEGPRIHKRNYIGEDEPRNKPVDTSCTICQYDNTRDIPSRTELYAFSAGAIVAVHPLRTKIAP